VSGLILPKYVGHKLGITVSDQFSRVWKPAILGSLPGTMVVVVWQWLAPPSSWLHIGIVVLVTAATMLLGTWGFGLDARERLRFKQLIYGRGAATRKQ
jgi:hypothetical protein